MSIWRWADRFSDVAAENQVTLGEGDTPLVRSRAIGPSLGVDRLYFKLETGNPAGSFKDRFGAAAISHMLEHRQTQCVATSSGNTGAALAAYCAAADVHCRIAIVETAPASKLRQMRAYGADVFRIRAFGVDAEATKECFRRLEAIAQRPDAAMQVSSYIYSAPGMRGVETISYELVEQAADGIDHVFCPAGGGGLCLAVARGFAEAVRRGEIARSPAVECVQPAGNNTIAGPFRDGADKAQEVTCTTQISGLQVANVNDGHLVIEECRPTGGAGHLVDDEPIWDMQRQLAQREGIFTEPAGAVSVAGAVQAVRQCLVAADAAIVCLVTGTGFKDEAAIDRMIGPAEFPLIDIGDLV